MRKRESMKTKLTVSALMLLGAMGLTAYVTFKSLEALKELDLSDPFEVDFDDK